MSFLSSIDTESLPEYCSPTHPFLAYLSSRLNTCIPTPLALISTCLGSLSIISWLFAQLPQIHKNYTLKSTAGLSFYFLFDWFLGDSTNLLGAIFTNQAAWQIVVAGYYVFVDTCLVVQFIWYSHIKPRRHGAKWMSQSDQHPHDHYHRSHPATSASYNVEDIQTIEGTSPDGELHAFGIRFDDDECKSEDATKNEHPSMSANTIVGTSFSEKRAQSTNRDAKTSRVGVATRKTAHLPVSSPRSIFLLSLLCAVLANASAVTDSTDAATQMNSSRGNVEVAGRFLSWASTLLYLSSRLPQLYKNHTEKSVSGLSPVLFIAAFFGNLFYSSSLLTNPCAWNSYPAHGGHGWVGKDGSDRLRWVELATPFWLGAAGVLAMDAAVGIQFIMFSNGKQDVGVAVVKVEDVRGHSHWTRVSGWMRGWIPSVNEDVGEEQQVGLLESFGSDYGAV